MKVIKDPKFMKRKYRMWMMEDAPLAVVSAKKTKTIVAAMGAAKMAIYAL